jgi:preprotein translocase subunit SecG
MVLDCVVLMFLVLIQLPKKEAGAGLAFGGSTTDALFGAGSGNVLTKITKYAAGVFFVLAVVLSVMQSHYHGRLGSEFQQNLNKPIPSTTSVTRPSPPPATPATLPATAPVATNVLLPVMEATNMPAVSPNPAAAASTNK